MCPPPMPEPDEIVDDLFHGFALAAFLEQARVNQSWPDAEGTRRRAYLLYEEALAERCCQPSPMRPAGK